QVCAHAGEQLLDAEGLDEVVVGTGVEPRDLVVYRVLGGEDDYRRVAGLADAPGDLEAVEDGQHEVEDHQVGVEFTELREAGYAVVADHRFIALGLQLEVDELGDLLLVFDDQYKWFSFHGRIMPCVLMRELLTPSAAPFRTTPGRGRWCPGR